MLSADGPPERLEVLQFLSFLPTSFWSSQSGLGFSFLPRFAYALQKDVPSCKTSAFRWGRVSAGLRDLNQSVSQSHLPGVRNRATEQVSPRRPDMSHIIKTSWLRFWTSRFDWNGNNIRWSSTKTLAWTAAGDFCSSKRMLGLYKRGDPENPHSWDQRQHEGAGVRISLITENSREEPPLAEEAPQCWRCWWWRSNRVLSTSGKSDEFWQIF